MSPDSLISVALPRFTLDSVYVFTRDRPTLMPTRPETPYMATLSWATTWVKASSLRVEGSLKLPVVTSCAPLPTVMLARSVSPDVPMSVLLVMAVTPTRLPVPERRLVELA